MNWDPRNSSPPPPAVNYSTKPRVESSPSPPPLPQRPLPRLLEELQAESVNRILSGNLPPTPNVWDWNFSSASVEIGDTPGYVPWYVHPKTTPLTFFLSLALDHHGMIELFPQVDAHTAECAFTLLGSSHNFERDDSCTLAYATYFVHLCSAAKLKTAFPKYPPISVRAKYDRRLSWPRRELYKHPTPPSQMFCAMSKEVQAINLATFLENEIVCKVDGVRNAMPVLQGMIRSFGKFEGFSILGMEDMSLLLTTIVSRALERYKDRSLFAFSNDIVELFRIILALRANTTAHLFQAVVAKLDGLEVPMCLALWLESLDPLDDLGRCRVVRDLFTSIRSHYLFTSEYHSAIKPEDVAAGMVMKLLYFHRTEFPFFLASLHIFMEEALDRPGWKAVWKMVNEQRINDRHWERIERGKQCLGATWLLRDNNIL